MSIHQTIWTDSALTARAPFLPQPKPDDMTPTPLGEVVFRLGEQAVCLAALVFLAPLLLLIALAIWCESGGPVLFGQTRIGRNGREFTCLKFRTMLVDAEARLEAVLASDPAARAEWLRDHKLRNDPRITPLGRFLRKSSLDEFPQLLNVLAGDMAVVGPRPIVRAEVAKYGRYFDAYCAVRPGITGLWQISGRNHVGYRRRVAMDVLYVRNRTPQLDFKIALGTVPAVLLQRGAH